MRFVLTLLTLTLLATGCDGLIVVVSTGPSTLAGVHVNGGFILIGTPVTGLLTARGGVVEYQVVPPRSGTLALGVNWDKSRGPVDVLFANNTLPRPMTAPPFAARVPVQAGQSYVVRIADGAPGDAGTLNLPFTLTATLD